MTSRERLVSGIKNSVHQAENLRLKATENDFNDRIYGQSLDIIDHSIQTIEEMDLIHDADKQLLAGICHLYLLGATINQSRAEHNFEKPKDKITRLSGAEAYLEKAVPIGKRLTQKAYLQTIDETPFIWPAEIDRGMGRIKMRHPSSETDEIMKAKVYFNRAKETGLDVYKNEDLDNRIRGAGLLTASISRVEELRTAKRLFSQTRQTCPKKYFQNDIVLSVAEIGEAEYLGYINPDRKKSIFRIIKEDLLEPGELPHLNLPL